jgi:predicted Fe-Mo cluster-binding NifX family protein
VTTVALPVFQYRIAPIFDSAVRVLVLEIEHQRELARSELHTKDLSAPERISLLKRAGVTTLICAGISNIVHTMLESADIRVRPGIVGHVDEVIRAYIDNRLDDPRFLMPGHGGRGADDLE